MYNEDLYKKLEEYFGEEKMINFSLMLRIMYYYIHKNRTENISKNILPVLELPPPPTEILKSIDEADYERDWWGNKHKELHNKYHNNGK